MKTPKLHWSEKLIGGLLLFLLYTCFVAFLYFGYHFHNGNIREVSLLGFLKTLLLFCVGGAVGVGLGFIDDKDGTSGNSL